MTDKTTDLKVGSLWKVRRDVIINKQERLCVLDKGSYGIIAEIDFTPFYRQNGKAIDRWTITFISGHELAVIRQISKATWNFYFKEAKMGAA